MSEITHVISAFSADQVVKLTGLTIRQLSYWDALQFFQPQYASEDRRSPYSRIYSFKDAVGLRTLSILKRKYGCSLPHLREVAQKLIAYSETPWADLTLYVLKKRVYFNEPGTGRQRSVVDGQYSLLPISSVIEDVRKDAELLRRRDPQQIGQIEKRKYISHQAEVISGTRIKVATILHFLEAGYSTAAILKEYPSLTEADIEAAKRHGNGIAA
jgi:uncharacterized protein (DUF433 family)